MPELPEVETIVRALLKGGRDSSPSIIGCVISESCVLWERTLAEPSPVDFNARLIGQQIEEITRRGKFICVQLSQDTLLVHLRMSGDLRVEPSAISDGSLNPFQKHDRLAINFQDKTRLVFNDTRKFGRVWLVNNSQSVLGDLGPEPLDPNFRAEDLTRLLQSRSRQLKPLLLDQSFIAGIGNIYADEALHAAGLHPLNLSNQLSNENCSRLWHAIRNVLEAGILRNGASIDWVYRGGSFQNEFRVYGRTGLPCGVCETSIQRIIVGQRSSHFCPVCQPSPPSSAKM